MPSQVNAVVEKTTASINDLTEEINILKSSINVLRADQKILEGKIKPQKVFHQRKYGLIDLIAGKTPSYSGWTVNPTDGANITDGDITTFCTTGNKVCGGGFQYAYIIWDLKAFYNVLLTGVMNCSTTAGNGYVYGLFWDGAWLTSAQYMTNRTTCWPVRTFGGITSKVAFKLAGSIASTITPNIREFHAWKLE